jgi:hypothetical protein
MEVSISRGLATVAELTHLIEKLAAVEHPETINALWQRFLAAYHEKIRQQNRALWFAYLCRQADSHRALSKEYERRAEKLCEEGNPSAA